MNLQSFRLVQRRLLLVNYLKVSTSYFPFVALCNRMAKIYNASKSWSIEFMDANFCYYSIFDRFIQRQPCACVCKVFFRKFLLRKY